MEKFCFLCGKKGTRLKDGYCLECYKKKTKLVDVPKNINLVACKKCELYRIKNDWKKASIEQIILNNVKDLEKNVKIKLIKKGKSWEITATKGKDEVHKVDTTVRTMICPVCARKFCDYYEATIQIRGEYNDKIMNFIIDLMLHDERKDPKSFFSSSDVSGGIDIKFGNKKSAISISETVKRKFDCRVTKSFKLVTMRDGQNVYRDVICIRFI